MKFFSMFSGIGGFELGIQRATEQISSAQKGQAEIGSSGVFDYETNGNKRHNRQSSTTCIGFSEVDKYAIRVYKQHFPKHKEYGNATQIEWRTVPEFDLLVGGFPCQAFSTAGKRRGFGDVRGTLFFEVVRCLERKRTRLFLLENVKGLLSHDEGRTFATILSELDKLGYDAEWQVLNSKHFRIPQNRERVFIVGYLRGTGRPEIFPIEGSRKEPSQIQRKTGERGARVQGEIQQDNGYNNSPKGGRRRSERSNYGGRLDAKAELYMVDDPSRKIGVVRKNISPTLRRESHGNVPSIVIPVLTPDRTEKSQNGRQFKDNGDPSFTLTAQDRHGIFDGAKIRRLTPTECERLQGFPDGWTADLSDTQRYKCLGNAVTVDVVEAICRPLLTWLELHGIC